MATIITFYYIEFGIDERSKFTGEDGIGVACTRFG